MSKQETSDAQGTNDLVEALKKAGPAGSPKEADEDNENAAFQQLVESAPPEVRGLLMAMTRTQVRGPIPHPLYDKFTPEHIDKFLDYSHQDDVNAYSFQSSNRWFYLAYAILLVVFLAFLIVFLAPNHKDLLADILKILAIFGGGFGTGFGVKAYLERKK